MSCDVYSPTVSSRVCNQLQKNNTYPQSQPLNNTTEMAVLEVNLVSVGKDEVHLTVHTNGPEWGFQNDRIALFWRWQLRDKIGSSF